jgi:hypothetical protein
VCGKDNIYEKGGKPFIRRPKGDR